MPGAAAQTYGIAFTGRFAVRPGVKDAKSSSATGKLIVTSIGASPRTRTRQPVGSNSQAGSTSSVQYQFVDIRTIGSSPAYPVIVVRCAATVPAGISPAAMTVVCRATATDPSLVHRSTERPAASARALNAGPNSPSR